MKIETQILGVNYTIYISEDKLRKACMAILKVLQKLLREL